jgi:type VII secretion protein EccB
MQSRRDQIQAHSFVMGRLSAGVLRIDVDGPDQPVSRTNKGMILGLVVGLLACVGVAVYGLIVPGGASTGWEQQGALVLDSDTGSRYLYAGGVLRPVLNATSARLIAGSQLTVQTVATDSLADVPRGAPFGIADAPDSVPSASGLVLDSWSACGTTVRQRSGAATAQLVLGVGVNPAAFGLTATQGVVVAGADGTHYLLWSGRRLRLDPGHGVTQSLDYASVVATPVTAGFLDAVPEGPDLTPPTVDGLGEPGPELGGQATTVGQLFADPQKHHYVLTPAGLAPLTDTLFALLAGDPTIQQKAYGGAQVSTPTVGPDDLSRHVASGALGNQGAGLPGTPPAAVAVGGQQAVCAVLRPGGGAVAAGIEVADQVAVDTGANPPDLGPGVVPSCRPADLVAMRPGTGALVAATPAGGGPSPTDYLVTDSGVKYPIASSAALQQLGYSASSQVRLPATVIGLLATGPSLDPAKLTNGGIVTPAAAPASCDD